MIETKQIRIDGYPKSTTRDRYFNELYEKCQRYIQDLTSFGWQKTQETAESHGRSTYRYQIMARETTMTNYSDYKRLEDEYEEAKKKIKVYNKPEFTTVLLLLLLLVLPGVLYITFKAVQKDNIKKNNDECEKQMKAAVDAAKEIKE